jgi:hypothetical protein
MLIFLWAVCPGSNARAGEPATRPTVTDSSPASSGTGTASGPAPTAGEQPATRPTATAGNLATTGTDTASGPSAAGAPPVTNPTATAGGIVTTGTTTPEKASTAGEQPVTGPTATPGALVTAATTTPEAKPGINPCATARVAGETWLDQTHDFVDKNLCEPAVWFDSFFGEDRLLEDVRPGIYSTLRESARWVEGKGITYINDFSLRVRLPRLERLLKKARIYLVSESKIDQLTAQPGQPVNPATDPATGIRRPALEVRGDILSRLRSLVSIDAGIKVHLPLDPFVRVRYQYTRPLGGPYLLRFSETLLERYREHFSETSQLDLERKISAFTILRWSNFATYTEGTAGVAWNTGPSLITQLTPKSAIAYSANMWGVSHPEWTIQNYRLATLYRRNFYRSWLFFELLPEVTWPKDVIGQRKAVYAFTATLEVQFGR